MDPRILPPRALERAQNYLDLRSEAAVPRDSASVLLVRETDSTLQVCTILRHHAMATAGGVLVFPGGLVDQQDSVGAAPPWSAGDPQAWADTLELDADGARAVVTTGVRELFEETGVLLAGDLAEPGHVAAQPADGWRHDRALLEAHETTFAEFLAAHGWGVRADLLHLWSTWLTPEFESRRYRARFFVAALPEGQSTHTGSTESTEVRWDAPSVLLDGARSGAHQLLAPQYCLSLQLDGQPTFQDLVAAAAVIPRPLVTPGLETVDGVPRLLLPDDLLRLAELV